MYATTTITSVVGMFGAVFLTGAAALGFCHETSTETVAVPQPAHHIVHSRPAPEFYAETGMHLAVYQR